MGEDEWKWSEKRRWKMMGWLLFNAGNATHDSRAEKTKPRQMAADIRSFSQRKWMSNLVVCV